MTVSFSFSVNRIGPNKYRTDYNDVTGRYLQPRQATVLQIDSLLWKPYELLL